MFSQLSIDCLFRTQADGRRVYYPQGWKGPGVAPNDAAQEAALRRLRGPGLRSAYLLAELGLALFIFHTVLGRHLSPAIGAKAGLVGLAMMVAALLAVLALKWWHDRLLQACPGIDQRLTRGDYQACLGARVSGSGLLRRIAAAMLLGLASLGLALHFVMRGDIVEAIPLALLAAALALPVRELLGIWRAHHIAH